MELAPGELNLDGDFYCSCRKFFHEGFVKDYFELSQAFDKKYCCSFQIYTNYVLY